VRERDYFFIASFSIWGLWVGVGIATLWTQLGQRLGGLKTAAPILLLGALPLVLNFSWASRADDYSARDWAYNLLHSVEPYGVLFTNGDNDTFPLWYLQEVEGIRRDVTVIVTSYLNTEWYMLQLKGLTAPCAEPDAWAADPTRIICQRPYEPTPDGPSYVGADDTAAPDGELVFRLDRPLRAPTGPLTTMPDSTIARVAYTVVPLRDPVRYQVGPISATLPAGALLQPWHQFALAIIGESFGERPIYFASSGQAPGSLGLDDRLLRQGLAYKLMAEPPAPDSLPPGVTPLGDSQLAQLIGRWLDVDRTERLLESAFIHRSGIPDEWEAWPDIPTIGIPNYYSWAYYALAQAAANRGDGEKLDIFQNRAEAWGRLGAMPNDE